MSVIASKISMLNLNFYLSPPVDKKKTIATLNILVVKPTKCYCYEYEQFFMGLHQKKCQNLVKKN